MPQAQKGFTNHKIGLETDFLDRRFLENSRVLCLSPFQFSRNAAERPEDIRPVPVLLRTMEYLLRLLDDPRGQSLTTVHAFLWDRFRAIRQVSQLLQLFVSVNVLSPAFPCPMWIRQSAPSFFWLAGKVNSIVHAVLASAFMRSGRQLDPS